MPPSVSLPDEAWTSLILLAQKDSVWLEGNILKVLDPGDSASYKAYLEAATKADKEARERRLAVTKQVQAQNKELREAQQDLDQSKAQLEEALAKAEEEARKAEAARKAEQEAKEEIDSAYQKAQQDLDYMQKRTQFELMGNIVRVALAIIIGVGAITTILYSVALFGTGAESADTALLANTWSNMFGILLTNSFSIIGTIMGVKYATDRREGEG